MTATKARRPVRNSPSADSVATETDVSTEPDQDTLSAAIGEMTERIMAVVREDLARSGLDSSLGKAALISMVVIVNGTNDQQSRDAKRPADLDLGTDPGARREAI